MMNFFNRYISLIWMLVFSVNVSAQWQRVYEEDFDSLPLGQKTGQGMLSNWETGSALGIVRTGGKGSTSGKYLMAAHSWTSFNQGPIFNLDLSTVHQNRIEVSFDLYTFGDWHGLQRKTGGPQHRLMFFDSKAEPRFAFDTTFATNF